LNLGSRHEALAPCNVQSRIAFTLNCKAANWPLDGIITSWNKVAERIFGYTAEEAVGRPMSMLIPADHLGEEPTILAQQ
jgi:PAS domain-containing protein